jgi:hypothetical protein
MNNVHAPKVSFVSLGCPKALVDSERIITRLRAEGYELSRAHEGADLAIVNTCGFLDSAQAESLAAIAEALARNGKVIVTGCMGAEPETITERYPGVLVVTGPQQYEGRRQGAARHLAGHLGLRYRPEICARDQALGLPQHIGSRPRDEVAAQFRDDAECAAIVAAF